MLPDNILFSKNPTADLTRFLQSKNYSKKVVLVDEHTREHCLPLITAEFEAIIEVKSGEEYKNLSTCEKIWQEMTDHALDRHACVIVLGGGVLGDMGGFCAATYKRGIDFILVPTTLLAQVDASIGGKLGIDFMHYKNHIGVFQQPALTLIHSGFLKSLPFLELRSGFAEVIKHCLIADRNMFRQISKTDIQQQDWESIALHSVQFKAEITFEDPRESGIRKTLNAGHTVGHAIESYLLASGSKILHGEAIAIGLIAEGFIALERRYLSETELAEITLCILQVFGKVELTQAQIKSAAQYALQDKKNKDNKIFCVLLEGIGKSKWDEEISIQEIEAGLTFYQFLQI